MKYRDPETGEFKELYTKAADTLPVGTVVDYDGDEVPAGWEEFSGTTFKMKDLISSDVSGTSTELKGRTITLNESIKNYDFLLFEMSGESYAHEWHVIPVFGVRYTLSSLSNGYYTMGAHQSSSVYAIMQFNIIDATHISIRDSIISGWTVARMHRIVGIKL